MAFFRILNEGDALREIATCNARINAIYARTRDAYDVNVTFLQLVARKYYEKLALVDDRNKNADKKLYAFIKSYDNDAKTLAKLWDRLEKAKGWLIVHGYIQARNGEWVKPERID